MSKFTDEMVDKARKFINENVPVRTRAQYDALLMEDEELTVKLIQRWMQLKELEDYVVQLEREMMESVRMPNITPLCEMLDLPERRTKEVSVLWTVPDYRVTHTYTDYEARLMGEHAPEAMLTALQESFHRDYVPALWEHTKENFKHNFVYPELRGRRR